MRGVNKVILIGHATRNAELRQTQTGEHVSSILLATNRTVMSDEATQYQSVVCNLGSQSGFDASKLQRR